ncbi:MAG: 1-acyl-sn-glycerol-3-phosphate acyltransferase [Burkholderiaceae bacterium]
MKRADGPAGPTPASASASASLAPVSAGAPRPPDAPGGAHPQIVFLVDARDRHEAAWLEQWLAQGNGRASLPATLNGDDARWYSLRLSQTPELPTDDDCWLVPVRMVWLPSVRKGVAGLWDDLFHGRVIAPGPLRRLWIRRHRPARMRPVAGEGARLGELRAAHERHPSAQGRGTLGEFIHMRAVLALEQAERLARGPRYKFPRLLAADFFANAGYARRLDTIAREQSLSQDAVFQRALRYMHEMAASQTPFMQDLILALYRAGVRARHDGGIVADGTQMTDLGARLRHEPLVFIISHKSMLDTVAFSVLLYDAHLPIPLTFGGINLRTFGIGALARRAGIIFLRRQFQDNPIYKATFRRYISYLIHRRFSLMWALEGTRSRTGKLLSPRFGMFRYVIEALDAQRAETLRFVPVSVIYDQITEVRDYAVEQSGASKRAEGMTWAVRFLRRGTPRGRILIRVGEGVTVHDVRRDQADAAELVPSLAYRVAEQMNAVTPITPIAVICLVLLAAGDRALTVNELGRLARAARSVIHRRRLELVGRADFRDPAVLDEQLGRLVATGVLRRFDDGLEPMVAIAEGHHHEAAYYRNTAIHHFLLDAIVEVCMLLAAEVEPDARGPIIEQRAFALRRLFRLEFYFPRRDEYLPALEALAARRFGRLPVLLASSREGLLARLRHSRPLVAHGVLRSFVDAYRVVIDEWLATSTAPSPAERTNFIQHCLRSGRQRLRERRIFAVESVSKVLYETAFEWASAEESSPSARDGLVEARANLCDLENALDTLRTLAPGLR